MTEYGHQCGPLHLEYTEPPVRRRFPGGHYVMKFSSQEMSSIGLLVPISLISSALIMHLGLTSSAFGLLSVIIAALAGGFLSGCLVSRIIRGKGSLLHPSWHIPLAGIMTALLAVIFLSAP